MQQPLRLNILVIIGVLLIAGIGIVNAQDAPPTPPPVPIITMGVGDMREVQVPSNAPESGIAVGIRVTEPQFINIIVRAAEQDGTNPQFTLLTSSGREIFQIDDNPGAEAVENPNDAVYENLFVIPDTYTLVAQRVDENVGSGRMVVTVETGEGDIVGLGQVEVINGELSPGQLYRQHITFEDNAYVSFAAMSINEEIDLQLRILDSNGAVVFENDDNETTDFLLDVVDPKLDRVIISTAGEYSVEVSGYAPEERGAFRLIITRFGTLDESTAEVETLTGNSLFRGRNPFTFEAQAGEVITITARAAEGSSLDPEIQLLDPDLIFLAINDDHQTEATDLGEFDARVSRVMLPKDGTYILEVNSVGGRGAFEVTIERFGKFTPADYPPLNPADGEYVTTGE